MASRLLIGATRNGASLRTNLVPALLPSKLLQSARTSSIPSSTSRLYSTESSAVQAPAHLDEGERRVFDLVKEKLSPTQLEVQDVSGGCGSMYALDIVSEQFKGMPMIKQHRLVNQVLGEEIKKWHGVRLKTKAP